MGLNRGRCFIGAASLTPYTAQEKRLAGQHFSGGDQALLTRVSHIQQHRRIDLKALCIPDATLRDTSRLASASLRQIILAIPPRWRLGALLALTARLLNILGWYARLEAM